MTEKIPFDPKLKKVIKEIETILEKNDVGGDISLFSKTHGEFLYHFPKWVGVTLKDGTMQVTVKKADFPSIEEFRDTLEDTIHALHQVMDSAGRTFLAFEKIIEGITEKTGMTFDHTPFLDFVSNEGSDTTAGVPFDASDLTHAVAEVVACVKAGTAPPTQRLKVVTTLDDITTDVVECVKAANVQTAAWQKMTTGLGDKLDHLEESAMLHTEKILELLQIIKDLSAEVKSLKE